MHGYPGDCRREPRRSSTCDDGCSQHDDAWLCRFGALACRKAERSEENGGCGVALSAGVMDLIGKAVDSIEAAEILLLLRRSPDTFWTGEAVSHRAGISEHLADAKLGALAAAGLLERGAHTASYRYAPADDRLRATCDELAVAYAERRVSVINAIYTANIVRLRAFANAFRPKEE